VSAQPLDTGDPFDFPVEGAQDDHAPAFLHGTGPAVPAAFRKPEGPKFLDADWDEEEPEVVPCICEVTGGRPLFYDGESHMIYGEGGIGKSWLGYVVCAQVAAAGGIAAILDYESNRRTVRLRMKALGVTREQASRIAYWKVTGSLMPGRLPRVALDEWIAERQPTFLMLDSVAKSMGAAGMNESDPSAYVIWQQQVVEPWTSLRITSLIIDHIGHINEDHRRAGRTPAARGASSKKDQVSGASYYFEVDEKWSRQNNGHGLLSRMKDREGWGRTGDPAAEVVVTVADLGAAVRIELVAPTEKADRTPFVPRYTWYMEAVCDLLATERDGLTASKVGAHFRDAGKSAGYADVALKTLVREGHVEVGEPGLRGARLCKVVKVYTAAWEDACTAAVEAGEELPEPPEIGEQF